MYFPQYYRQARIKALTTVYPELASEYAEGGIGRFNYPRPISEPPSPLSSRHTTPAASIHGSDDEDEVDDEKEVNNLSARDIKLKHMKFDENVLSYIISYLCIYLCIL